MAFSTHPEGATIALRVQPRASRAGIRAVTDDVIRLAVAAPPADGSANEAVIRFLSEQLRV